MGEITPCYFQFCSHFGEEGITMLTKCFYMFDGGVLKTLNLRMCKLTEKVLGPPPHNVVRIFTNSSSSTWTWLLPPPVPGPSGPGGSPSHLCGPLLKQLQRGRRSQGYQFSFTKNLQRSPSFNINSVFLDLGGRDRQGRGSEVEAHWPETQSDTRSRQKGCHGYLLGFFAIEHLFHNCKPVAQVMNEVCRKHKIDLKIWWSHNVAGMKLSQDFVFAPIWRTKKDCVACTQLYVTRIYAKKNIYQYIGGTSCFLSIWSVQQPLFICSRKG